MSRNCWSLKPTGNSVSPWWFIHTKKSLGDPKEVQTQEGTIKRYDLHGRWSLSCGSWEETHQLSGSKRGEHMSKFIIGIVLTVCVLVYGAEIRKFTVDTGIRDKVVVYLKSWWEGYPKSFFDFGIPKSYFFSEYVVLKHSNLISTYVVPCRNG